MLSFVPLNVHFGWSLLISCAFLQNLFCSEEASSIRLYSLGTAQHIKYSTIVFKQYISRPEQLSGYRGRKAHAEIFLDCHPSVSYEAGLACLHSHRKNAALFWQLQADNCNSDTNHMKSVPGSFLSQRERERLTEGGSCGCGTAMDNSLWRAL